MKIVKDGDFHPGLLARYVDTPYFKAMAPLAGRERPELPAGLEASTADDAGFSEHIGACYADEWISAGDLRRERALPVYDPALWLALRDRRTGGIAASGIAQLDPAAGEGVLDWIQVSPDRRRRGWDSSSSGNCCSGWKEKRPSRPSPARPGTKRGPTCCIKAAAFPAGPCGIS